jgi:uncharacterized protein (TIGR03067 family)
MSDPQTDALIDRLRRSNRRWKAVALGTIALLVLAVAGMATLSAVQVSRERAAAEETRLVAEKARRQAEQAEQEARQQADKALSLERTQEAVREFLQAAAVGTLVTSGEPPGAEAREVERLAGTWKVVAAERDGQADEVSRDATTTFTKEGRLKVRFADNSEGEGTYKLDPTARTKAIDYTLDYGPNKGKVLRGIYSLEGDTLKICRSDPDRERPADFATRADSGRMLFVLKRVKP